MKKSQIRTGIAGTFIAALAIAVAGCAGSPAAEPSTAPSSDAGAGADSMCPTPGMTGSITLVNPAQLSVFSSFYMAYHNDMFSDAGIDVQVETMPSADALPLLAQGSVDLLMTSYSAAQFNAVKQGVEMQWVMPFDYGQDVPVGTAMPGFWARKDVVGEGNDIDLSTLKGKTVSSPTAGTGVAGMILDNALKEHGAGFADVTMTRLSGPDALAGLANGAVSAAWIAAPLETEAAKNPDLVPIAGYAPGVTGTALIAGPTGLEDPKLLTGFIQVINAAIEKYLVGDYREDADVVAQLAEILETSEEVITNSEALVFDPMSFDGADEFITGLQDFQIEHGQLDYTDPQDPATLFDPSFVEAALTCSTDWMKP